MPCWDQFAKTLSNQEEEQTPELVISLVRWSRAWCLRLRLLPYKRHILIPSFKKQFSSYLADDIGSEDIEEMYTSAYEAIREDPVFKPTEKDVEKWKKESLARKQHKLTKREARIQEKIAAYKAGKVAVDEDDE